MAEQVYAQIVNDLMQAKSREAISNGEPAHAQALFEAFFEFAEKEVLMFCHNLDERVFDSVSLVEKAQQALEERNIDLHVILQCDNPPETAFLRFLKEHAENSSTVSLSFCTKFPKFCDQKANFSIMDRRAYRFEEDRKEIKAIASMNQPETAGALARVFNGTRSILST